MSAPAPPPPGDAPDLAGQVLHRDPVTQAGFVQLPNVLLFDPTLTAPALRLYAILKHHAWKHGHAWPGQDRLAALLCVTTRSVRTYISELRDRGLLTVEQRGLAQTNRYFLEEPGADWPTALPLEASFPSDRKIASTPRTDRKKFSDQERKPVSALDRMPASYKEDRVEEDKAEADSLETSPPLAAVSDDDRPDSIWIANTIHDHLREIGDVEYQRAPLSQVNRALALWQRSGLSEAFFVSCLQQTRDALRHNQSHVARRGAWYFRALEELIAEARHAS